ncbi:NADH-quinone oxidoreductase subunit C [Streptomyces sp. NPDC059524]|uniref:NADH-quinone oxidoreductase subunit C n=1 Tax=Streptomyces sp. NPDC059524 TaxID=3346856 RepID=UPI0036B11527
MSWLPSPVEELFGADATVEEAYDLLTVDVPADTWLTALETARTTLGCTYFDWLSAVDEPETGFRVCAHVAAVAPGSVRRLLLRTTVPHAAPVLPSAVGVYAGAAWHERETHEMFGVDFTGHPHLVPLLLPDGFEGHPLRKDFVLAARVAKAWPGAKEPGESEHGGPKRRQMLPPGVPDPNDWGPMKGQLPPAPARPARGAGRAAGAGAAGERPARRARSASEGSASQTAAPGAVGAGAEGAEAAPRPARRTRSASEGSASQRPAPARSTEGAESSGEGGQGGTPAPEAPSSDGTPGAAESGTPAPAPAKSRPSDAPWHHARPAFDEPTPPAPPAAPKTPGEPEAEPAPEAESASGPVSAPEAESGPAPEPEAEAEPAPVAEPEPDRTRADSPEGSEGPGTPEGPEGPGTPEGPEGPGAPEGPGTPDSPENPERPEGGTR